MSISELNKGLSTNIDRESQFVYECERQLKNTIEINFKRGIVENVSEVKTKSFGTLTPKTRQALMGLVQIANQFEIKLNPYSTGFNWGFGSSAPVTDDTFQLDLSQLNQISDFDSHFGFLKIEPGVTQRQLSEFLENENSNYIIDLTGSTADSSIIGNALDRGITYYAARSESIINMEILLSTGEIIQTGYLNWENSKITGHYKYAPGPMIDSLFYQSNFGIILSVTYQLKPKWKSHYSYSVSFNSDQLEDVVDAVYRLKKILPLDNLIHIANKNRVKLTLLEPLKHLPKSNAIDEALCKIIPNLIGNGEWILFGSIMGPEILIDSYKNCVESELHKIAKVKWQGQAHWGILLKLSKWLKLPSLHELIKNISYINKISMGHPSNRTILSFIDKKIPNFELNAKDIDREGKGFIFCAALAPLQGQFGREMMTLIENQASINNMTLEITLNAINKNTLEAVISLGFDRKCDTSTREAKKFMFDLQKELIKNGFPPYRLGVDKMELIPKVNVLNQYLIKLKEVFDKKGIFSPKKYQAL